MPVKVSVNEIYSLKTFFVVKYDTKTESLSSPALLSCVSCDIIHDKSDLVRLVPNDVMDAVTAILLDSPECS